MRMRAAERSEQQHRERRRVERRAERQPVRRRAAPLRRARAARANADGSVADSGKTSQEKTREDKRGDRSSAAERISKATGGRRAAACCLLTELKPARSCRVESMHLASVMSSASRTLLENESAPTRSNAMRCDGNANANGTRDGQCETIDKNARPAPHRIAGVPTGGQMGFDSTRRDSRRRIRIACPSDSLRFASIE